VGPKEFLFFQISARGHFSSDSDTQRHFSVEMGVTDINHPAARSPLLASDFFFFVAGGI
jgi:hypothetical protein